MAYLLKIENKKFKVTGDSRYIYQNELDKACFHFDMACGDFKDSNRRIAADNVLRDKAFNPNLGGLFRGLFWVACILSKLG